MPPAKPNPAAGKKPANARVSGHTRADGTKVRAHTRSTKVSRITTTWVGAAASGAVCLGILAEAGFTILSTTGVLLIAAFTWLAVIAGEHAEKNKTKMNAQSKKRKAAKRKPAARRTTRSRTTTSRNTRRR